MSESGQRGQCGRIVVSPAPDSVGKLDPGHKCFHGLGISIPTAVRRIAYSVDQHRAAAVNAATMTGTMTELNKVPVVALRIIDESGTIRRF